VPPTEKAIFTPQVDSLPFTANGRTFTQAAATDQGPRVPRDYPFAACGCGAPDKQPRMFYFIAKILTTYVNEFSGARPSERHTDLRRLLSDRVTSVNATNFPIASGLLCQFRYMRERKHHSFRSTWIQTLGEPYGLKIEWTPGAPTQR
jgi:hypothetical protein